MNRLTPSERIGSLDDLTWNVLSAYRDASDADHAEGRSWYVDAADIAEDLGVGRIAGAGILAALSPQKSWTDNVELARRASRDGYSTGHTGRQCDKVDQILAGASPLDVLGAGRKSRAFFSLIAEPCDPWSVVVDRHAYDAAVGRVTSDVERKAIERVGGYDHVADAYRAVAVIVGVSPSIVQATVWVSWRRLKNRPDHPTLLAPGSTSDDVLDVGDWNV